VDVLPHVMFLFGALALALAITRLSIRPLIAGVGICVLVAALTAIKWVPMLLLLGHFHRPWPDGEVNPLAVMVQFIFSRAQNITPNPVITPWGFWEYGTYVSPIIAAFAGIGVLWNIRRALPWLLVAALVFAAAMGAFAWYAPWVLLHRLPIWSDSRLPSRFLILFTLCVGVLAGLGADVLIGTKQIATNFMGVVNGRKILVEVLLVVALIDYWWIGPSNLRHVFDEPARAELSASVFDLGYVSSVIPCSAVKR